MKIFSIPTHFNCLTYAVKTYFKLKKNGLIPELSFSNCHLRVYVFFAHHIEQLEYIPIKPSKLSPFVYSFIHFFIPFRGYVKKTIFYYEEIKNGKI